MIDMQKIIKKKSKTDSISFIKLCVKDIHNKCTIEKMGALMVPRFLTTEMALPKEKHTKQLFNANEKYMYPLHYMDS